MKDTQRNTCIQIVETIISHPASGPFRKPVDKALLPNYYEIIEDPQDFGTILEQLKNKDIRSIREFKRNMNLVWENAVTYNGKDNYPSYLAFQCKKIFENEMKLKLPQSTIQWFEQINDLQKDIRKLSGNPPNSVKESVPVDMIEMKELTPLTGQEYKSLFSSVNETANAEEKKELMKLLNNPTKVEDLMNVSLENLRKATDIIKERTQVRRRSAMSAATN